MNRSGDMGWARCDTVDSERVRDFHRLAPCLAVDPYSLSYYHVCGT